MIAARDLADEHGIEAVTMRRLGQLLGVEAMSLYNHVASKDDVVDGIVDLVVGEIELPHDDVEWVDALRVRAVSAQQMFARHPWASRLIDTRTSSGPQRLRYLDWMIGTLRRAGFEVDVALHAISLMDSYVEGFARQQSAAASGGAGAVEPAQQLLSEIPPGQFPHLRELITHHIAEGGYRADADFAFGLHLILDGLQRLLDRPA